MRDPHRAPPPPTAAAPRRSSRGHPLPPVPPAARVRDGAAVALPDGHGPSTPARCLQHAVALPRHGTSPSSLPHAAERAVRMVHQFMSPSPPAGRRHTAIYRAFAPSTAARNAAARRSMPTGRKSTTLRAAAARGSSATSRCKWRTSSCAPSRTIPRFAPRFAALRSRNRLFASRKYPVDSRAWDARYGARMAPRSPAISPCRAEGQASLDADRTNTPLAGGGDRFSEGRADSVIVVPEATVRHGRAAARKVPLSHISRSKREALSLRPTLFARGASRRPGRGRSSAGEASFAMTSQEFESPSSHRC